MMLFFNRMMNMDEEHQCSLHNNSSQQAALKNRTII